MSCKPCEEKKAAQRAAEAAKDSEILKPTFWAINCFCGLTRCLPTGLEIGDVFDLVPCPKCGTAFTGKFLGNGVEQL